MKIRKILVLFIFFIGTQLFAQSNEIIDEILVQERLSVENGAYLGLTAAGLIVYDLTPTEALSFLKEKEWIRDNRNPGDEMSLGEYSFILMKGFSMSGGLMYTLFPSPRYASRELGYKGFISRDAGAYRSLSGSEAVSIIGQIVRSGGN